MKNIQSFLALSALLLFFRLGHSQVSLHPVYQVSHADSDIFYGAATGYRGCADSLHLDLYKPVNNDAQRPLVILVHGGGFVAGNRKAATIVKLADSLASRGYVVASIDYRKGIFQPEPLAPSLGCIFFQAVTGLALDACAYPADTLEMYRACYRGQQDLKGAIRFLKARSAVDSTNKNCVFLGGESAGGYLALAAALLDLDSEKPVQAAAVSNVTPPAFGSAVCNSNPCPSTSYTRPDLGGIRGDLNLNGETDEVAGVINIYGGLLNPAWMDSNVNHPRLYLHHQPCDPVVPFNRGKIYGSLSTCINCAGCPPFAKTPMSSGGGAIRDYNNLLPAADAFDIWEDFTTASNPINCYYGLWGPDFSVCSPPGTNCPHCSNSLFHTCHSLFLTPGRMDSISLFLFDICMEKLKGRNQLLPLSCYPNPAQQTLNVVLPENGIATFVITTPEGKTVMKGQLDKRQNEIQVNGFSSGIYLLTVTAADGRTGTVKFVKD